MQNFDKILSQFEADVLEVQELVKDNGGISQISSDFAKTYFNMVNAYANLLDVSLSKSYSVSDLNVDFPEQ
jgi:hypothetical protein